MSRNLFALRQTQIDLKNEADAIFASAKKNGFTPGQRARLADLKVDMEQVQAAIQEREYETAFELNPNAPLAAHHGKGNDMYSSTSTPKIYNKLSDQLLASGMKPTQRSDSLAPFASLGDQLRSIRSHALSNGASFDPRLAEIQAALGGNESVPAEGGFLVIPEYAASLLKKSYDVSQIAKLTFKMPMQSSRLIMHVVDEDSRKDGSRWGGLQAFWLAEGATYSPTKPKFREMQFVANKLIALCYATEEQLADGPAYQSYIEETVPMEFAFAIDQAIYNGPGAGAPLGFNNSGAVLVVAKDASQTAATITTSNVVNMWSRMWARSRQDAVWLINQDIEPQLIPLTLGSPSLAQILIYTPPGILGNPGPFGRMFGRDVIPTEFSPTLGSQGDIALVDLNQYTLAQRNPGMRADTSIHVAFLTGEQAFRFMLRLDGQPNWKKPITPYQGSVTKSPFVTLAARS